MRSLNLNTVVKKCSAVFPSSRLELTSNPMMLGPTRLRLTVAQNWLNYVAELPVNDDMTEADTAYYLCSHVMRAMLNA